MLEVNTRTVSSAEVIDLVGDLTGDCREPLNAAVSTCAGKCCVVNLDRVKWVDSAGQRSLLSCAEHIEATGGAVVLALGHLAEVPLEWLPGWPLRMYRTEKDALENVRE